MSFNPLPGMLQGEQVMASMTGVDFSCVLGHVGTFKARGELFVTNIRLLFVAKEQQRQNGQVFGAFDIPLRAILDVRFNQPILFAPNLEGRATPVNCLGFTEPFAWKAAFKEGGTTQFVHSFLRLMDALARSQHPQPPPPPQQQHQQPMHAPQPPMWQPTIPTAVPVADLASSYATPHPPPPPTTPAYTQPPPPSYAPQAQHMPPPASAYVDPLQPSVVLVGEGGDPMAHASAPPGPGPYEKGRW